MSNCNFRPGEQVVVIGLRVNDHKHPCIDGTFIREVHTGSNKGKYIIKLLSIELALPPDKVVKYEDYHGKR